MEYITISDGKITGHYCGETLPPGAKIVNDFNGCPGDPVEFYTHTWQRKSDIELIQEGLIPIPLGYKLDGDKLTEMSLAEKIQSGIEELPIGYKLEEGEILPLTQAEKIQSGIEELPIGYKLENNEVIEMSLLEKIKEGISEIPKGLKILNDTLVEMTDEEKLEEGLLTQEEYNKIQQNKIQEELNKLDAKTIRPLRAILSGNYTQEDKKTIEELEKKAKDLRQKLQNK